jgi:H+-transporting ATPase
VIGALLVVEGLIGVFIALSYFHLDWKSLQTLVMLMLVFTSQFRVLVVRERKHFWNSRPGRELLISSILTIFGFALLGTYNLIIPRLKFVEVLFILGFSALFTLGTDFPKYYVFRRFGLASDKAS